MSRIAGRDHRVWEWLIQAGVVTPGDFTRRVIIDMDVSRAVMIYVEKFGSDGMFTITAPDLGHAIVTTLEPPASISDVTAAGDANKVYLRTDGVDQAD